MRIEIEFGRIARGQVWRRGWGMVRIVLREPQPVGSRVFLEKKEPLRRLVTLPSESYNKTAGAN